MARPRATTTEDIVAAAARVFELKGYANSTIDDICLEAGISRPTIYKYIKSKPWLLEQMVTLVTEKLRADLSELRSRGLSPREEIQAMVDLHVRSATSQRVYYATVFTEQPELSPESKSAFRSWSHQVTSDFAHLIDAYRANEGISADVDATVLANLVLTMLTGLFRWYDPDGPTSPTAVGRQALTMLSGPLPGVDVIKKADN